MDTISKHPPETGHKHPPSTREQRGLALFHEDAVSEHGDLFVVRSASRRYTVSLDRETCTCPDFGKRRDTCKHLFAVVVYAAKKHAGCRRQRTAHPAGTPQRRHDGLTERPRDDRAGDGRGSGPHRSGGITPAAVRANLQKMEG